MSGTLPPASSLGYLVNHLARLLAQALRERIEPYGVVPGQFAALLVLYESDGLTQAELCARVQIEQPTMANTLARMERDGLITRTPDPTDLRRSLVRLTRRARRLESALTAAAQSVNTMATHGLSDEQIGGFHTVLRATIANLERTRTRRRPAEADPVVR